MKLTVSDIIGLTVQKSENEPTFKPSEQQNTSGNEESQTSSITGVCNASGGILASLATTEVVLDSTVTEIVLPRLKSFLYPTFARINIGGKVTEVEGQIFVQVPTIESPTAVLSTEAKASQKYRQALIDLGVRRNGQKVKVCAGRYTGLVAEIAAINWSDAELMVNCKPLGGPSERWVYAAACLVLDPDHSPMPVAEDSYAEWNGPVVTAPRKQAGTAAPATGWMPGRKLT